MGAVPEFALPAAPGRLIGRDAEVAALHQLLSEGHVRLLTVCGVGGIGKTRVALEVARAAQTEFTHGVRFVELAPVREPTLVLSAIAATVAPGLPPGRGSVLDGLKRSLQRQHLLLLLDNFEQVLDAAPLVAELLAACSRLTILATSRAPLRLSWERQFVIGPLAIPPADLDHRPEALRACASVELFMERMLGLGMPIGGKPEHLTVVAAICRRLDGIPLALELAAARARVLAPPTLLTRLEHPLELLAGGPRDAPARHQALRSSFDWSYELLTESDRCLFRALGVFAGGCTFDAAAQVCQADANDVAFLDALGRLVDSGLVSRVEHEGASEPRLSLIEPVREYALEQLQATGEEASIRRRHATAYLDLAERADPELGGLDERVWLARLERDHGNALVALRWLLDQEDAERSLRLASALCTFWWVRGFTREGLDRLRQALTLRVPQAPPPRLALARAVTLSRAGTLAYWQGDHDAAQAYKHAALALFGDGGEPGPRAEALIILGHCALARGDSERAEALYMQSLEFARAGDDQGGVARASTDIGYVAFYSGRYDQAHALLTDGVAALRAAGDLHSAAYALRTLATLHCLRGDFDAAQACVRDGVLIWRDTQGQAVLPNLLEAAAIVAVATGEHVRGLRLAAGAAAVREEIDTPAFPAWTQALGPWLDRARVALGPAASMQAWADGFALGVHEVLAEVLKPAPADSDAGTPQLSSASSRARRALPSGLTLREAEVLRLLAGGSTNKEIASQLSVSVATIERHLANAYGKIGARGRADATAFAITRGLVASVPIQVPH